MIMSEMDQFVKHWQSAELENRIKRGSQQETIYYASPKLVGIS